MNLSQLALANASGMSQQGIVKIEKGLVDRPRRLAELAEALNISQEWLLGEDVDIDANVDLSEKSIAVPVYGFRAGMGGGGVVLDERPVSHWQFPTDYLQNVRLNSANLISIEVEGDSNAPTLMSGDRVMINLDDKNPARGGMFAIHDSDTLVVKRVEKIPNSDPVMLRLISDNANHNSYDVIADDTNIIGRVVWYARRI